MPHKRKLSTINEQMDADQIIQMSLKAEDEELQLPPVPKSLGFEIVDYAIDYIGFKANVSYFEAGN